MTPDKGQQGRKDSRTLRTLQTLLTITTLPLVANFPCMTTRRILLADADAFYVAVARLVDPEGAGKAPLLIVGGSADHRGVVTSASYEARKYGVQSAMPMARALRLCPDAVVVPVPMAVCVHKGREIRH